MKLQTKGQEMYGWAQDLFPINRSISGEGLRETLCYIQSLLPQLKFHEIKTGEKVFDWVIKFLIQI